MVTAEYLAGFIDGEGTISASAYQARHLTGRQAGKSWFVTMLRVEVFNRNLEALEAIQQSWGGRICTGSTKRLSEHPRWAKAYVLSWKKRGEVNKVLKAVLPYLLIKRPQVECVLANWPLNIPAGGPWGKVTPEDLQKRMDVVTSLRHMNKRGPEAQVN